MFGKLFLGIVVGGWGSDVWWYVCVRDNDRGCVCVCQSKLPIPFPKNYRCLPELQKKWEWGLDDGEIYQLPTESVTGVGHDFEELHHLCGNYNHKYLHR